jgi:hypothetical protein
VPVTGAQEPHLATSISPDVERRNAGRGKEKFMKIKKSGLKGGKVIWGS